MKSHDNIQVFSVSFTAARFQNAAKSQKENKLKDVVFICKKDERLFFSKKKCEKINIHNKPKQTKPKPKKNKTN